jgi:hypothetical protein
MQTPAAVCMIEACNGFQLQTQRIIVFSERPFLPDETVGNDFVLGHQP